MPPHIAMVVMMMGRARLRPASTIASARARPRAISAFAKSTSMIAFFVTTPISMSIPMTTGRLIAFCVSASAMIAPPIESGREKRIVIGCTKLEKRSTRTAKTIISPALIALPKFSKTSAITSASPNCLRVKPGGRSRAAGRFVTASSASPSATPFARSAPSVTWRWRS